MSEEILEESRRMLRANTEGELQFDEHLRPIKVVIAPDGRVIAPVMVAVIEAADTVLFLPHADEDSLQIQVTVKPFGEEGVDGALADRWRIYHGEPPDVNWAVLHLDGAKFGGAVIDGDALTVPNPLARGAPAVLKEINQSRRDDLRDLVKRALGLDLEVTTLVGIDPWGIDVRGPFDVVRIEFDARAATIDEVRDTLERLLERSPS